MKKILILISALFIIDCYSNAQRVGSSPEYIESLTSEWKGERLADGRPYVSDTILVSVLLICVGHTGAVVQIIIDTVTIRINTASGFPRP